MAYAYSDRLMPPKPILPRASPAHPSEPAQRHSSGARWLFVEERLTELAALPSNWNDDGAPPISVLALEITRQLLALRPPLIRLSELFPSPEGGVLIEYVRGSWDLTVEISADGTLEIFGFEIDGTRKLFPHPYPSLDANFFAALDTAGGPQWL
ncbi:hypothetical protein ACQ86G_05415 [Roseateles chitinivorans]|uniref:hypothetical protein n=1 Tax=Roseateles chitinivorans TaxID=2917965 RepID=UPI003D67592F